MWRMGAPEGKTSMPSPSRAFIVPRPEAVPWGVGHSRTPKQRLPDHLKHLRTEVPERRSARVGDGPANETPSAGAPDRLGELLPLVLRAMVDERAGSSGAVPLVVSQADILAALAPYHRPRSRFEGLMVRKLVGEGYLRPRGARDKRGLSDAYTLTPKAEQLLGWRKPR